MKNLWHCYYNNLRIERDKWVMPTYINTILQLVKEEMYPNHDTNYMHLLVNIVLLKKLRRPWSVISLPIPTYNNEVHKIEQYILTNGNCSSTTCKACCLVEKVKIWLKKVEIAIEAHIEPPWCNNAMKSGYGDESSSTYNNENPTYHMSLLQ
jgi:hypothetical protein